MLKAILAAMQRLLDKVRQWFGDWYMRALHVDARIQCALADLYGLRY